MTEENQKVQLMRLLEHAVKTVPFYRRANPADLSSFPVITKAMIRSRFREFASSSDMPVAIIDTCLAHMKAGNSQTEFRVGDWYFERSSGTTGPAVWYPRNRPERMMAAIAHCAKRREFLPEFQANRFADVNTLFYQQAPTSEPWKYYPARIYADLKRRDIKHIYGQISLLFAHAADAASVNHRYDFETVEVGGEYPDEDRTRVISEAFGAEVLCQYGCRETLAIGYARPGPSPAYSLLPTVHVEILDQHNQRVVGPGETGRIVVTSLFARAFPIIRFETGDNGSWIPAASTQLLQIEHERDSAFISLAGGKRVSGAGVFKRLLGDIRSENGGYIAGDWKVRRTPEEWTVYLLPGDMALCAEIKSRFASLPHIFGDAPVVFAAWEGWRPLEKQILFSTRFE